MEEFFTAELRPNRTLGFFYEALDEAAGSLQGPILGSLKGLGLSGLSGLLGLLQPFRAFRLSGLLGLLGFLRFLRF